MLISPSELPKYKNETGNKAWNLKLLKDAGFQVPDFFVLPASEIIALENPKNQTELYNKIVSELRKLSLASTFAVRSCALNEDTLNSSLAGQFLTKINIKPDQIPSAISEVIQQAKVFLNGDLKSFSIIIQDYIPADISGVCFTRNPKLGREMVLEYHKGIGEDLVSGKISPKRLNIFWNDPEAKSDLNSYLPTFKSIETFFKYPQDIEWVVNGGQLYILQSRPITNLTQKKYAEFLYLDSVLPNQKFLYEKTELSEIAPRPTDFTLSLLEAIYAKGGPADLVYQKYNINYTPKNFLKIVGNELFADREQEISSLFPSYSYFPDGDLGFKKFNGLLTTFKNIFYLQKISLKKTGLLFEQLKNQLTVNFIQDKNIVSNFLKNYTLIFEVNLLAAKALKDLESAAAQYKLSVASLLQTSTGAEFELTFNADDLLGNSLEVSDESKFFKSSNQSYKKIDLTLTGKLSKIKQAYFLELITKAQNYSSLREYGRWLTVKYISHIRHYLLSLAKSKDFKNPRNIFFAKINELEKISESELQQRRTNYESFNYLNLDNRLTSLPLKENSNSGLQGVSGGSAQGIAVDEEHLNNSQQKNILITKTLSPNLTAYFPKISGIISEQGGMLSHLAIVAREQNLPIIITKNLPKIGSQIIMDADKPEIRIIP